MTKFSENLAIRCCTSADAAQVRELRLLGLQESPESFGGSYEEEISYTEEDLGRKIDAQYSENKSCILGAWQDSNLVGMVGLRRLVPLKLAHKAQLWGMYVHPESRGQGVARELLTTLMASAKEMPGLIQISLSVVTDQKAACSLYRSFGFQEFGVEQAARKVGSKLIDEFHMILMLKPEN